MHHVPHFFSPLYLLRSPPLSPSQVHRYYRLSGGTLDKAAAEAARGAAGNKYVRDAAKGAVRAGVSAATSSE